MLSHDPPTTIHHHDHDDDPNRVPPGFRITSVIEERTVTYRLGRHTRTRTRRLIVSQRRPLVDPSSTTHPAPSTSAE